jgi:hypothetical protein
MMLNPAETAPSRSPHASLALRRLGANRRR